MQHFSSLHTLTCTVCLHQTSLKTILCHMKFNGIEFEQFSHVTLIRITHFSKYDFECNSVGHQQNQLFVLCYNLSARLIYLIHMVVQVYIFKC